MSGTTSDIVCLKSPAYVTLSHKPAVYDYVSVKDVHSKSPSGASDYMELGPHPLDAPAILPELGGKKVLYSNVQLIVSCPRCSLARLYKYMYARCPDKCE